jgi:pimeloyl-ACP methyl ester carboxylesterase
VHNQLRRRRAVPGVHELSDESVLVVHPLRLYDLKRKQRCRSNTPMSYVDPFDADRWPRLTVTEKFISGLTGLATWFAVRLYGNALASRRTDTAAATNLGAGSAGIGASLLSSWIFFNIEYTKRLNKPESLADPDSNFSRFCNLNVRWKERNPEPSSPNASVARRRIILLHGFGASLFTFRNVMDELARKTGSNVEALDLPAFGLTSRSWSNHHYSLRSMAEVVGQFARMPARQANDICLVGHSLGGLVALQSVAQLPCAPRALILVSPAIYFRETKQRARGIRRCLQTVLLPLRYALATVQVSFRFLTAQISRGISPVLRGLVRLVVSQERLWRYGLRLAVEDRTLIRPDVIEGYRLPDRVRGWDRALLAFVLNRYQGVFSIKEFAQQVHRIAHGGTAEDYTDLLQNLRKLSIPVLIIHGRDDRIVPLRNSQLLAQYLGCELCIFDHCGHLPHEEMADRFIDCVERFIAQIGTPSHSPRRAAVEAF